MTLEDVCTELEEMETGSGVISLTAGVLRCFEHSFHNEVDSKPLEGLRNYALTKMNE